MKSKLGKIDKLSVFILAVVVVGILSSFIDFGIISVFFSVVMPLIFIINCVAAFYGVIKKRYISVIGVVLFFLFLPFFFQFSKISNVETQDVISILTYNTREFEQSISGSAEKNTSPEIIRFVDSLNSDILVFQESAFKNSIKFGKYPFNFIGYRDTIVKSLLAIYSKYPIVNKGYIDFPDTRNNAIYADIKIKQDTIRIYNSHLQSFVINKRIVAEKYNDYNYLKSLNKTNTKQIEQAQLIKKHADAFNKKVIICGDFNATPYSQTYRILKKGMKDSYLSKGIGLGATFSIINYPLRLDYILNNEKINVLIHQNFKINLSDHEPVFIKFKIK